MNKKDLIFLTDLKKELVLSHEKCKGTGYIFGESVKTCECMKILKYIIELKKSQIPIDYWDLSLKELEISEEFKNEVILFSEHIDNAISQGVGMLITGSQRGIGKTSLACEIGKEAIIKRYKVYYNLMQSIVSNSFTDEKEIINEIKNSDLVIIDELDKVSMRDGSNLTKQIENFLRELLPVGKSLILCSNSSLKEIDDKINLESLVRRYMQILEISGTDFSIKKNNEIKNKLNTKINYFSKNIKKSAERFFENEDIANEREFYKLYQE